MKENHNLIEEFERLCEGFTFEDSWIDSKITPDTFRIYTRNVPAKEASRNFVESVKHVCSDSEIKLRLSHQEWSTESQSIKHHDNKC